MLKVYERVSNFLEIALGCGMDSIFEFNLKRFCTTFNYTATPVLNALKILTISGYIEFIEETDTLSRVMILVHREELYNLRDCDPQTDRVLQCLLRSYTGLFADYIYIHEDPLAQRLGIDQHAVYEALLKLNRLHVLHYVAPAAHPLHRLHPRTHGTPLRAHHPRGLRRATQTHGRPHREHDYLCHLDPLPATDAARILRSEKRLRVWLLRQLHRTAQTRAPLDTAPLHR